jgi:hypothetical protein
MPSPFPGMNPYLEHPSGWPGFHNSWIAAAREALVPQVVPRYYVEIQQDVYLSDATDPGDEGGLVGYPDIGVGPDRGGAVATSGTLTVSAPARVTVPPPAELLRMSYMEVRDADSNELVTVIELLSPSNKAGEDRQAYLRKWRRFMESRVHFVEVDLLRGGQPTPWGHRPPSDYSVTVSRWEARPTADHWPIRLRERLPVIPIPLREGDPEPTLDLQTLLHRVYDAAGYQYRVYRRTPEPPLAPPDDAWAVEIDRAATPTA